MDRPTTAKIGHLTYKVEWLPDGSIQAEQVGECYGDCDAAGQTFRFEAGLQKDRLVEIIAHEMLHAYWEHYGLKSRASEENAVRQMACAVATFIRDNPNWIRWIGDQIA